MKKYIWKKPVKLYYVILISFYLINIQSFAVQFYQPKLPDPIMEPWRWRAYPELEGKGIQCMAEGKDGTLWFGSENGLVFHYDGLNLKQWSLHEFDSLLSSPISNLLFTKEGILYVGTEIGLFKLNSGHWKPAAPLSPNFNWSISGLIEAEDGTVYAGTKFGLLAIKQNKVWLYTARDQVEAIQTFANKIKLVVVPDKITTQHAWSRGFGIFTRGKVIYALASSCAARKSGVAVGDSILATNGNKDSLINLFNNEIDTSITLKIKQNSDSRIFTITLRNEFIPETLHELLIYNLFKEKTGGLWFSQDFGNITYFKENQGIIPVWQTYSLTSGLNPNVKNTYQFAETLDGNIWASLSQPQSHLNRFDRKNWTGFPISQIGGILNVVTSMLVTDDGAFWLGGWGILYIYQNKSWRLYKATEIPISDTRIIHLLETSDHTIWFINKGMNVMSFDYSTRYWTMLDQLNFHGETKDGKQWFLGADGRVICRDQNTWYSYGVEDGLMNAPVRLQISRTGEIWAAGSHGNVAATAYWDGQTWCMTQHPELSWGIDYRAVFEDWQGALWFGAAIDFEPEKGQLGGALRIKDHQITHLTSVLSSNFMAPYGIGQAKDNSIWFGGIYGLFRLDRSGITKITEPTALTQQSIDVIYTSPQNDLWIGTRYFGIFYFDIINSKWISFNLNNGLSSNKIIDITITDDGRIWTATNVGYDCYDGKRWSSGALPSIWHLSQDGGSLKTASDGSIWINQTSKAWNRRAWPETPALKNYDFRTLRYKPDKTSPHTWLFKTEKEIPQPGNAVFTWHGKDPWNNTAPTKIQYSWRLDNGEWSQFSTIDNHVFFKLPSGSHTFEVKSRDLDLNEDPTPAIIHFKVLPPVWRQPWFISLITVLTGIICFQTIRIIRRDLKLHETNKYLARERSIEHLRAVFMSIRSTQDISESIRELGNEIKAASINHNAICIYLLDEAIGILHQFEMIIPDNQVHHTEFSLDSISSIFLSKFHSTTQLVQPVSQNLISEILLAKESSPLQVIFSQAKYVLESCFENGILLISTHQNEGFSDDESKTIKGYLAVIAAGYAKYLSLRKIEKQQSELMRIQLATIQERLENELTLERLEKEKERQVALLKQQFFTDISHEFRTPLTLILSPLQKIIAQIEQKSWLSDQISIIHKNAERLLRLVNQLLDFRKLEEGCLTIDLSQGDLIQFIKNIADTFIPTADEKGILFQFSPNQENLLTWFDPDKIDKIIYNLLCNAFKFTPENGKIIISIHIISDTEFRKDNYQFVEISVNDNGIGIPPEDHKRIFERFYQVLHQLPYETKGSGIGLALTKELIELLGGSITVESEPGKGATFWVRLPIIEQVVLEDESAITRIKKADNNHEKNDCQKITSELFIESAINAYPTKPKILLVEDNDDVRSYIRDDLSDQYDIAEASNGTEGLKTARKIIPDLIITDIIMPDLDGIELCKILKNDVRTSHIPIILLTARSTKDDEAQGLAIGADDYIVKPFNVSILKARVKNLILSRQQLRERFSRDIKLEPENIYITSVDEKFLTRVIKVIDENMDDSEFGVEKLSQIVKMNRVQLYRKIKSLTNHTVNDFIRILRLKRAAQLLKESKLTVTEIAFEVGFSDSSNFARDFRKHFGTTPSLYARQPDEKNDSSL